MNALHRAIAPILAFLALTLSGHSVAYTLPDMSDPSILPENFPCLEVPEHRIIRCQWTQGQQRVRLWDDQLREYVSYNVISTPQCNAEGQCYHRGVYKGETGIPGYAHLQIHYYLGLSTDGRPLAYRFGTGPGNGGVAVSYNESVRHLFGKFKSYGLSDAQAQGQMVHSTRLRDEDLMAVVSGTVVTPDITGGITEAWCNPRADDECYINEKQVAIADLDKYLPRVDPDVVEARGGSCDYPICYDDNYKPIGIRQSL